jgi:diguanylate cyclase (GGDEF)-like protein
MIENHRFLGAQGLLTVSVGVATLNDDTTSEEDLVRRADEALYRAKADGRNCVRVAAQELA